MTKKLVQLPMRKMARNRIVNMANTKTEMAPGERDMVGGNCGGRRECFGDEFGCVWVCLSFVCGCACLWSLSCPGG